MLLAASLHAQTPTNDAYDCAGGITCLQPIGIIDGSNPAFTLRRVPIPGSADVYLNGSHQRPAGDYTISGATIRFNSPPTAGSTLDVRYRATALLAAYDPTTPTAAPSYSTGAGATIAWFHDQGYTLPAYGSLEGQTVWGILSQPATASAFGTLANGTLSQIDATHVKFTAAPSILPCHSVEGLQTMPCDMIFFTRVDSLPWISSHSIGDGSGWCEDGGKFDRICQGDPTKGTGWYTAVAPAGSTCITAPGGTVYSGNPGSLNGGGGVSGKTWQAPYDCHVVFPSGGINFGGTTQAIVLDGTEPGTWSANPVYPSFSGPFPSVQFRFNEFRESGMYVNLSFNCNNTAFDVANPPFSNCKPGGPQPFYPSSGGIDAHEFMESPTSYKTWEVYNDERFGALTHCQNGQYNCGLASGRHIQWSDYNLPPSAIGAAGTPENQIELTVMDLAMAAVDPVAHPIQHAFAFTEPLFALARGNTNANRFVWPAQFYSGPVSYNNMGALEGERKRLDSSRASLNGGLSSVTVTGFGGGYPAGAVIVGTVTGCQSIDGTHPAQVNAFIGANGQVVKSPSGGQVFAYIVNTGQQCVAPRVDFPAPPVSSGATITATLTVWNLANYPQSEQNDLIALYNQATQYGGTVDDVGFGSNESFRTEIQLQNPAYSQYRKAAADFYSGFGDGMLWGWVDTSSLAPTGATWPNMQAKSWMTDSTNALEGNSVINQNVIALTTPAGVVSYNPIPTIGIAVGFNIPNIPNQLNILAGMTPIDLAQYAYVSGDPTDAGVVFSWVTDPCPGADSLTGTGVYTTCQTVSGVAPLKGQMQVTSAANPAAFTFVWVTVLPSLSIDVAGGGGCVNGAAWTAGKACSGAGTTWSADCTSCFYFASYPGARADYPHWTWASFGGPAAPLSVPGESAIYQSFTYSDPDITASIVVPNGNYAVRELVGNTNLGGSTNTQASVSTLPYYAASAVYTAQGNVQRMAFCMYCQVNYQSMQPVDVTVPAKVSDNVLKLGMYGYSPSKWLGWDKTAHGGNPVYVFLSGLQIRPDSTAPHWEIGSYAPGMAGGALYSTPAGVINGTGDNFTIPLWNGVAYSPEGAPQPGILQLYIRDWYTGSTSANWSILSGPGTIAAAGLFTAPTTQPSGCTTVQAQSVSTPAIVATQQICYSAAVPAVPPA